jgi:TolA-binding protein
MHTPFRLPSARLLWPATALVISALALDTASAQAPAATLDVQDSQRALELFNQGKYAEAAALYEGIPQKYPTSPMIPEANFRLGYIGFVTGDYDKGIAALRQNLTGKNVVPEVLEISLSFIPQILAAKAGKMMPDDPQRKPAFQAAVKEFDNFIQKYPASAELESAYYGKARALYANEQYEEAAAALRTNLQKFPQSPSLTDTQFMLALVLGTQANVSMQKATAKDPTAIAAFDESVKILNSLLTRRTDIAVANDAQFQLGEILFSRGNFEQGDARAQFYRQALEAFRGVQSKDVVLKAQQDRIALIRQRQTEVLRSGDVATSKRIQRFLEKEQEKTAGIEQRADQTLASKIKSAQIFISQENFDAARVLLRYLEPQIEDPGQKKQVAYYLAVTYAAQNLAEKAVELYDKFMATYPSDPIAENLPLLVGAAYLSKNDSENALKYFKQQAELYPNSPLAADAVMRQALALIPLNRFDEALGVLNKFLEGKHSKEQGAAAQLGVATIYQRTRKIPDALKAYITLRDNYVGTPEAEQAAYWAAKLTLDTGDAAGAVAQLQKFTVSFPSSELLPPALFALAQAQAASGDKTSALKTYSDLAAKFPKSEPAPITYFQRAGLHQKDNELAEVKKVMSEFIANYPDDPKLFAAYDYVAQIQFSEKALTEAIATYEAFIAKRPEDPACAKALAKSSGHWKKYGEDQGPYLSLNETQRTEWRKGIDNSIQAAETLLGKFPGSGEVSFALQNLLASQRLMVRAKLKSEKELQTYFEELAAKNEAKPATRNKILFTLAGHLAEKAENDPWMTTKTLELMTSAYDPKLLYAPNDLDLYGAALIRKKEYELARSVYSKLAKDYPLPRNVTPDRAPRDIGDAQSIAAFGEAKILQNEGKIAEAAAKFAQLKENYPFSSKRLETDYGIAEGEAAKKNYDEALKLLKSVAGATQGSTNLRARAMMLVGKIAEDKGDIDTAINNYVKLGTLFPAETDLAPEGLWRGAQLIEKKLNK